MADGRMAREELAQLGTELAELRRRRDDVEAAQQSNREMKKLVEEEITTAKRATRIVEAQNKVLWGVVNEQAKGVAVPLAAILARIEIETKVITQDFGRDQRQSAA